MALLRPLSVALLLGHAQSSTPAALTTKQAELSSWNTWLASIAAEFRRVSPGTYKLSVCESEHNTERHAPLTDSAGTEVDDGVRKCTTSGAHSSETKWEDWDSSCNGGAGCDVTYVAEGQMPSCAFIKADMEAGTPAATVYSKATTEDKNEPYHQLRETYAFTDRAVLAGGSFTFKHNLGCAVFFEPTVGAKGKFQGIDMVAADATKTPKPGEDGEYTYCETASDCYCSATSPTATSDIYVWKPTVLAGALPSSFSCGKVTVVGGTCAGELAFQKYVTQARILGQTLESTGVVRATGTSNVFIADTVSAGSVIATDTTASLLNISNSGAVTVTGGTFELYEVTNQAAGTVTISGLTATLGAVTNKGSLTVSDSTAELTAATNAAGATITVYSGTYTFKGNLLVNDGKIVAGAASAGGRRLSTATPTTLTVEGGVNRGQFFVAASTDIDMTFQENAGTIDVAEGATGSITLVNPSSGSITGAGAKDISVNGKKGSDGGGGIDAAVLGGAIGGGVGGLLLIGAAAMWYCKKKKQAKQVQVYAS